MIPRSNHPQSEILWRATLERVELLRGAISDHPLDDLKRDLGQDLFRAATYAYAVGVELEAVRDQMQESVRVGVEAGGLAMSSKLVGFLKLLGLELDVERLRECLRDGQEERGGLWGHLLSGERPWTDDPPGYPKNAWLREECQFVDRVVSDPASAPSTIAAFLQAWVDERQNDGNLMAYEVAAMAKMHGVDDSALVAHPYYPYELVHTP